MNPRAVQVVSLALCVILIGGAATLMSSINDGRRSLSMIASETPLEQAPPEYAFAIQAFGAFRGLIVDLAFIRAEEFKQKGRFFDAMQLASWICKLQPRFPSVWEFASWNMAWNISVATHTPEERWNWVYNGVKLLRDEGIPKNPRAINLYKQLAWTFNNKMSESIDDYHGAYKANWSWRMHLLLGQPPAPVAVERGDPDAIAKQTSVKDAPKLDPLFEAGRLAEIQNEERRRKLAEEKGFVWKPTRRQRDPGEFKQLVSDEVLTEYQQAVQAMIDWLEPLRTAPKTLAELYQTHPDARNLVASLRDMDILISDEPLLEEDYWRDGGLAFTFFEPYRLLAEPLGPLARIAKKRPRLEESRARAAALDPVLGVTSKNEAGQALVLLLQQKVLRDVYKMDPDFMAYLVETFGPLDWRTVDSQSLYWVTKGMIEGKETLNTSQNDRTNTARIIFFSLRNLYLRGRVAFDPDPEKPHLSYLSLTPEPNYIEPMHQAFLKYGPLFDPDPGNQDGAGSTYRTAHTNFLQEAIRSLYFAGREREAARYYAYMQETYFLTEEGRENPFVQKSLYDFVMTNYLDAINTMSMRDALLQIGALVEGGFASLSSGNATRYTRMLRQARELYEAYMKDKQSELWAKGRLAAFDQLVADVFRGILESPSVVPAETIEKTRLWAAAPVYLRQQHFDEMREKFSSESAAWDFDAALAFPEPPGMAEYRLANTDRTQQEKKRDTETLPMRND